MDGFFLQELQQQKQLEEDVDRIFLQKQQPATRNMFLQDQSAMRTQTFGGRSFGRSPWGIRASSRAFESRSRVESESVAQMIIWKSSFCFGLVDTQRI